MKQVVVSTRIPAPMYDEARKIASAGYLNDADFFRAAIRKQIYGAKAAKIKEKFMKDKDSVRAVRELRRLSTSLFTFDEYMKMVDEETKDMPV
ncbi:MAG: hypothetical protein V1911_00695 [Candidatus Micrarchaeota archaeon]